MARTRLFGALIAALLLLCGQRTSSQSLLDVSPAWGEAHGDLRIGIARTTPSPSGLAFTVVLHNSGKQHVIIDLGEMLSGPGPRMSPSALRLALADSGGSTRELQWVDWCNGVVPGHRDFILVLPAGAFHLLPIALDRHWDGGWGLKLPAGRYRIRARIHGPDVEVEPLVIGSPVPGRGAVEPDPLPAWRGTALSGDAQFDLPSERFMPVQGIC